MMTNIVYAITGLFTGVIVSCLLFNAIIKRVNKRFEELTLHLSDMNAVAEAALKFSGTKLTALFDGNTLLNYEHHEVVAVGSAEVKRYRSGFHDPDDIAISVFEAMSRKMLELNQAKPAPN